VEIAENNNKKVKKTWHTLKKIMKDTAKT